MTTNSRFHVGQQVTAIWGNDPSSPRYSGVVVEVAPGAVRVRFPCREDACLSYWDNDSLWSTSGVLPLVLRSSLEEGEDK